jgi:ATP-dependent DNA helicase DinG
LPPEKFPSRELLILDEAHQLETEIVGFTGISISKRRWKRYIPNFKIVDYGYDIEKWINFLIDLETILMPRRDQWHMYYTTKRLLYLFSFKAP